MSGVQLVCAYIRMKKPEVRMRIVTTAIGLAAQLFCCCCRVTKKLYYGDDDSASESRMHDLVTRYIWCIPSPCMADCMALI